MTLSLWRVEPTVHGDIFGDIKSLTPRMSPCWWATTLARLLETNGWLVSYRTRSNNTCQQVLFHQPFQPAIRTGRKLLTNLGSNLKATGWNFFYFFIIFFRFVKNICRYIFLQICHPAASSSGGRKVPPDEPAVSSLAHGPSNIPPFHPAVPTYRRMNWR